jgi:hypothetical protein
MIQLLENLAVFIAKQLDKLKVSNPIVFVLVQGVLVTLSGLFATDAINIPTPESILAFLNILSKHFLILSYNYISFFLLHRAILSV